MTFLRPEFLYGLLALTIPIIIHLFNFRRHKKLYFSDISRLKNLTNKTRKQKQLKYLIVLALRLLTITAIVLALAGPVPDEKELLSTGSDVTTIIIDNSNSMMAEGQAGRLFETARSSALNVIGGNPDNTNFIVLSSSPEASNLRILDKEAAISAVEEMQISANSIQLSNLVNTRNKILDKNSLKAKNTLIFSDFQNYFADIHSFQTDSSDNYVFIPYLHLNNKNLFIDSCAIETPAVMVQETVTLSIWIKNNSDFEYEKVPLRLFIDNQQKAVSAVDLPARSAKKVDINFSVTEKGWHKAMVIIEDFPITFDDAYYFTFEAVDNIKIAIINNNNLNHSLVSFYDSDEIFSVENISLRSIDINKLSEFDLLILNELPDISSGIISSFIKEMEGGTNVLYIPPGKENISSIDDFLAQVGVGSVIEMDTNQTRVKGISRSNQLFSESIIRIPPNAELPVVLQHYKFLFPTRSGIETLVSTLSGNDFLSMKNIGAGKLFILAVGLEKSYGNFSSQLLFAPIMHGIASKKSSNQLPSFTLGETKSIRIIDNNYIPDESPVKIRSLLNETTIIPGQRYDNNFLTLDLSNTEPQQGFNEVIHKDTVLALIAFNFNRNESVMEFLSNAEIEAKCFESGISNFEILNDQQPEFSEVINALKKESEFWKLFIIFALFTLLAEVLVLRFWK